MTKKNGYVVQPKGKALYEDTSSFGSKMLAKMGWTKGKGLGANENGSVDFVRVKYKNDAGGFGYTARDDQWTENESGFNTLLQSLNDSDEAEAERKRQSLEEKSKLSRARVHYQKFTRGKDISRYSAKDLANIFGKKDLSESYKVEKEKKEESDSDEKTPDASDKNYGTMIINTGVSITDYFKNKRKSTTVPESVETPLKEDTSTEVVEEINVKKKKKRKREVSPQVDIPIEEQPQCQETAPPEASVIKKKSKKSKKDSEDVTDSVEAQPIKEEAPTQETKNKKKPKEGQVVPEVVTEDTQEQETNSEDPSTSSKKPKRKKKSDTNKATVSPENLNTFFLDTLALEKLKNLRLEKFKDSNVANIVGYGMSKDVKLEFEDGNIVKGISRVNKYSIYSKVDKMHSKSYYKSLLLRYHKKRNTFKLE